MLKKQYFLAVLLVILAIGCATGSMGRLVSQQEDKNKVTIDELIQNWENFHIYHGSRDGVRPSALMFDPKDSGTALSGDSWRRIKDKTDLKNRVVTIQNQHQNLQVELILGPEDKVFGFMYSPGGLHIPIRVVDADTLYVMSLPKPISAP